MVTLNADFEHRAGMTAAERTEDIVDVIASDMAMTYSLAYPVEDFGALASTIKVAILKGHVSLVNDARNGSKAASGDIQHEEVKLGAMKVTASGTVAL
jgi:hydroxymethylglutaryl-CoA reductase